LKFDTHLVMFNLLPVYHICTGLFQFYDQLFQAEQNRLPESNYQEREKDCINNQAADIEDILFDFDKHDQLIIVHRNAEGKVNPAHHLVFSRLSLHPS